MKHRVQIERETEMTKKNFEIYLIVDAAGECAVGADYDQATEAYDNDVGGGQARRIIKITAAVTLPKDEEAVAVDVPDEAGQTVEASA